MIAYVVGCIQNLQAEFLGYGHHSHPVSKEKPADTVRLLIVLLDNFADNRILAKYICVTCVRHCLSIGETSAEVHTPTLKLLLHELHKF